MMADPDRADSTRNADPAAVRPGAETRAAGFDVVRELGRGNHTVTYQVRVAGTDYAMKVLHRRVGSPDLERAFRREAALLAAIDDPRIARVHEVGTWRGQPYLLMDLIQGRQLSQVIADDGPLPVDRLLAIGVDVALALQAAHRVGVMHRDIKPDNIIVEDAGTARVIDFGLAARWGDTDDDTVSGTMLYCAPEQAGMLNRAPDGRADLYALGTVLYEGATGRPPFVSADLGELLRMHASLPAPDPRTRRPDLPPAVAAIVGRLLAKDPDDRYQSAFGLVADLRVAENETVAGQQDRAGLGTAENPLGRADAPVDPTVTTTLVGRDEQLSTLYERWERARTGAGGAVLIEGAPGVGKSRLAAELTSSAGATGALVLVGKSDPDQSIPLAPLRAAIEGFMRGILALPEPERAPAVERVVAAAGTMAALLRHLSPALDSVLHPPVLAEDDRQQQFSAAVAGFLVALARSHGGAVLHLDDVQWLDDATRKVLQHLSAGLADEPLLLVATARLDADSAPAVAAVRAALGRSLDADLRLPALSVEAVGELISSVSGGLRLDEASAATMAARSDGNPFTLLQYLTAIVDSGLLRPSWGRWLVDERELAGLELPADGRDLVVSRLDGLDAQSRYLLGVAAVVGARFSPDLVADASRTERRRVWTVAAGANARNLVERRADGGYAFLHDQIREALLSQFDPATLRGVHERIADVLDERGPPDPAGTYLLARHRQRSGVDRAPAPTQRACTDAGRLALADHAPVEALDFLSCAVEAAAATGTELDAGFLQTLGVAQHRAGRFHDADATLRLAHSRGADSTERARTLGLIARVHDSSWNTAEQATAVQRALAELGRPLPTNPFLLVVSTVWLFVVGVLVGVTRIGYGTATGARRDEFRLIASLYDTAALAYARQLQPTMSVVFSLRSVFPVNRLGTGPEQARMDIAGAHLALVAGQRRLAGHLTARAVRIAADLADPRLQAYVAWLRALDRYFFGTDQGESVRRTVAEQGRWLDPGQAGDLLLSVHWDALLRGDLAAAQELYDQRADLLAGSNQPGRIAVHASEAGLLSLRGQGASAVAHLQRMRADRPDPLPWETVDILYGTLLSAVERRDLGGVFDRAVAEFEALGLSPLMLVPAQRGLFVYLAYGRLEQCRRAGPGQRAARLADAEAAVKRLRRIANIPILRAHSRVALAALRQLKGEPAAALAELSRSEPVLRAVDAALVTFEATRVRTQALRALGLSAEADRQARFALSIAVEQGWPDRVTRTAAEFGLAGLPAQVGRGSERSGDGITLGRYRQRLAAIEQVGLAASRVIDPAKLVAIALDETIRILGAERAFLFLPERDPSARGGSVSDAEELVPQRGRDAAGHDIDDLTGYSHSVVERVRRSRQPLVLTSTEEGAAIGARSVVRHGLRSVMAAALQADGRLLGVVYLDSRVAKGMFSDDDVGVLAAVTNHIAVALETARAAQLEVAVATANRQRDVAETMRDALAEITGQLVSEPEQVLRRLLGTVRRFTGDQRVWLVLSDSDGEQAQVFDQPDGPPTTVVPDPPLVRLLALSGPQLAGSAASATRADRPALLDREDQWLAVPLLARDHRLGILLLASADPAAYAQGRAEIVAALVGQAMVAYENARLFARVREMATTDDLTGLANRAHFFDAAERAMATARHRNRRIAAMMIDVDHFKRVNDTYGHQIGDQVLHTVAERLGQVTRDSDLIGRYGGEEFAVVLPDVDIDAVAAAERLRRVIAATPMPTSIGPLEATISVGVTYQHDDDADLTGVLARADRCLLGAKRSGRNRVHFA